MSALETLLRLTVLGRIFIVYTTIKNIIADTMVHCSAIPGSVPVPVVIVATVIIIIITIIISS